MTVKAALFENLLQSALDLIKPANRSVGKQEMGRLNADLRNMRTPVACRHMLVFS